MSWLDYYGAIAMVWYGALAKNLKRTNTIHRFRGELGRSATLHVAFLKPEPKAFSSFSKKLFFSKQSVERFFFGLSPVSWLVSQVALGFPSKTC